MGANVPKLRITSVPFTHRANGTAYTSQSHVEIDGLDISSIVTKVDITMEAGHATMATLTVLGDAFDIDTDLFEVIRPHIVQNAQKVTDDES